MELSSKKIQVGDFKVNASYTKEMYNDLSLMDDYYKYKFENIELERSVFEKYLKTYKVIESEVHYKMNEKLLRKIKLLILNKCDSYEILQKIIRDSSYIGNSTIYEIEKILIDELSKSIDKEVLRNIMKINT